jgi:hypothetical protein
MRSAADAAMCDLLWRGIRHYARGRANRISACAWDRLTHTGFTEKTLAGEAGNVILRLDRPAKDLFAAFSATQRNQARLAMKNGVTVKPIETDEQFAEYYELYTDWSKMKGFDMQPMEMQRKAIDLRSNRIAFGAYLEGKLIASSTFRFCPGGVLEYAANNSRREDTKVRPNDLLVWTAVQWACEHGFKSMSMGGSHFFLRKFGGEIVPSFIYSRDETLLKIHDLREFAESVARRIYRLVRTQIVGGIVRRAVRKAARLAPAPESR